MLKFIRFTDNAINYILRVIFIIILLLGTYFLYDSWYIFYHANDTSMLQYKPDGDQIEELKNLSDDVVAWITIDDTSIDYPVMQGKTNDEYLNKNPYGEFALSGSIFLDSRNKSDFSDPYSLIYGHHMEHDAMFGGLDRFLDEEYLKSHRTGTLTTVDGKKYDYHIFASTETQTATEEVFAVTEVDGTDRWVEKNAEHFLKPEDETWREHIVALSTCKIPDSIDRTLVFGYITESGG